jgi:hypothetical protein
MKGSRCESIEGDDGAPPPGSLAAPEADDAGGGGVDADDPLDAGSVGDVDAGGGLLPHAMTNPKPINTKPQRMNPAGIMRAPQEQGNPRA